MKNALLLSMAPVALAGAIGLSHAGTPRSSKPPGIAPVPFAAGERLAYDVHFGPLKVGTGSMEVTGVDTVRGRAAYHTTFRISGAIPLYRVDDAFESWFATDDLSSLRFHQDRNEGDKERQHRYEI